MAAKRKKVKLSPIDEFQARRIRQLLRDGDSFEHIAKLVHCNVSQVRNVIRGQTFKRARPR